jgi:hypothetical protein
MVSTTDFESVNLGSNPDIDYVIVSFSFMCTARALLTLSVAIGVKFTDRGARTHDHQVKSLALYRLG